MPKKTLALLSLIALLLAACQPAIQTPPVDPKTPLVVPGMPTVPLTTPQAADPGLMPAAALAAQAALAQQLGLPLEDVTLVSAEVVDWPDGCLGLGGPEEACLAVIVPGYRVTLRAQERLHEFRTDLEGTLVRAAPAENAIPPAAELARQVLAAQMGLSSADEVVIVEALEVQWPNSCLGVERPDTACAEVITPGYLVFLEYAGQRYEFHTDLSGQRVAAMLDTQPQGRLPGLFWELDDGQTCQQAQISSGGAAVGLCGGQLTSLPFPDVKRTAELAQILSQFAPFEAETPSGRVRLLGRGTQIAAPAEQRAVADWAALAVLDAQGLLVEPLLTWRRTGGIAGECLEVKLYASGWFYSEDCNTIPGQPLGQGRLALDGLEMMYNWFDSWSPLTLQRSEGNADGYQYDLEFRGRGGMTPGDADQQALFDFAQRILDAVLP